MQLPSATTTTTTTTTAIAALAFLLLPTAVLGTGGRCAGHYNTPGCICIDRGNCQQHGGDVIPGSPGDWPCPSDPANVMGCLISDCKGTNTGCQWADTCKGYGRPLPDPVCPGGSNFVCCGYY